MSLWRTFALAKNTPHWHKSLKYQNMEVSKVNMTTYDELTKLSFVVSLTNALVALLLSQTSGDPPTPPSKMLHRWVRKPTMANFTATLNSTPPKKSIQTNPRRFMRVIQASKRPWHTLSFKGAAISLDSEICCGTSGRRVAGERSFFGCWRCLIKKTTYKKRPLKKETSQYLPSWLRLRYVFSWWLVG